MLASGHWLDCAVLCTGGNIPLTVATPNTLKMIAETAAMTSSGYNTPCRPDNLLFMSRPPSFSHRVSLRYSLWSNPCTRMESATNQEDTSPLDLPPCRGRATGLVACVSAH